MSDREAIREAREKVRADGANGDYFMAVRLSDLADRLEAALEREERLRERARNAHFCLTTLTAPRSRIGALDELEKALGEDSND
jgi:hypothetical protein